MPTGDIALLDALEQLGVKTEVLAIVRKFMGYTQAEGEWTCGCSDHDRARTFTRPHSRKCSLWNVVRVMGFEKEQVLLDHNEALVIEGRYRSATGRSDEDKNDG